MASLNELRKEIAREKAKQKQGIIDMECDITRSNVEAELMEIERRMFTPSHIPNRYGNVNVIYSELNKYLFELDQLRRKIITGLQEQKLFLHLNPKDKTSWKNEIV